MSTLHPLSLIKQVGQLLQTPKLATIPGLLNFHRELEGSEEELEKFRARSVDARRASEPLSNTFPIDIIPSFEEKAGNLRKPDIACYLWLNSSTLISEDTIQKVNTAAVYLKNQGFELRGVKADGNCYCHAFLKSYESQSQRLPIIDVQVNQENKIIYLRDMISLEYLTTRKVIEQDDIEKTQKIRKRAQQIKEDTEWLDAFEGDLLANALSIPIRTVTVNLEKGQSGINDMMTFPHKDPRLWNTIDESEKPQNYIFIVDLGGHFVCAQSLSAGKQRLSSKEDSGKLQPPPLPSDHVNQSNEKQLQLLIEITDRLSACLKKHESNPEFAEVKSKYLFLQAAYEKEKAELNPRKHQTFFPQESLPRSSASVLLFPQQESKSPPGPLKPLDKNPLKRTHPLGFALGISVSDPYYKQYPEWCESVQLTFPRIVDASSYRQALVECKRRMGMEQVEQRIDSREQEHLNNIARVLNTLIETLSQPNIDLNTIPTAITTIYEEIYELLVCPINKVYFYILTPLHILTVNQQEFRLELLQSLPPGENEDLVSPILSSIADQEIENVSEKLQRQYPDRKQTIQALATKAQLLLQQARQKAQDEIDLYRQIPDIKLCFEVIFSRCLYLEDKYEYMKCGRYSSRGEMPSSPAATIVQASYLSQITGLLRVCETFRSSTAGNRFETFKGACEQYLKQRKAREHFQTSIVPLLEFLQVLKNILMWPQEYEIAPGEFHFIRLNLNYLMTISNKNVTGSSLIPYKYLSISEEDKKTAEATLNKDPSLQKKREACRLLLHARIPWAALQALGCLLHTSGGVSEHEKTFNQQLVRDSLEDLIPNLPRVKQAIEELLEFELSECSAAPPTVRPSKLPEGCYAYIQLLGNMSETQRSIKKILEILEFWRNLQPIAVDFEAPKVRYAALRTIQILGELSKNLHEAGILNADTCWDNLEELRDLLSHSERISLFKRLQLWLLKPEGGRMPGFFKDFRTLDKYFNQLARVLKDADTWAKRKKVHQSRERPANLELTGLQDLYVFLAAKISREQQLALLDTLKKPEAVQAREEIVKIKEEFSHDKFDPQTYQAKILKLPLTKIQQKLLEEAIKVMLNPRAAENNHRSAKPGMLKKVVQIIEAFKKNKKLNDSRDSLEDLTRLLTLKNYSNNPQNLETIPESQLVEDPTFPERIAHTQKILEQLKQEWTNKGIVPPQLNVAEEYLRSLQERIQEFIERKKVECQEIIENIPTHPNVSVQEEGNNLIRSMQIKVMPLESLQLAIKALGISGPDGKLWEAAHAGCTKKKETPSPNNKESDKNTPDVTKKKALQCIEAILDRIQKLYHLVSGPSRDQEYNNFCQDPLLQLACQCLVSDFRAASSSLELYLESLKYPLPLFRPFFSEIQQTLLKYVQIGNDFLHMHEVTEPWTSTNAGHVFRTYAHLSELLRNFSLGKDHNILMESFGLKLNQLRDILANKNI